MEAHPTPRQMAKGLSNGIAPTRPLLLPVVFSLGAKVENVPLGMFLSNPTKISNALRQMRGHLCSDGVPCYFDPLLEVEALGATLERVSDDQPPIIHWPAPAKIGELPHGLRSPEQATKSCRVSTALEVIRRMNALPQRDFLLMANVTGPLTLASHILQGHEENTQNEKLSDAAQELAAEVATQMASVYVEAGADLITIQEEVFPIVSAESCEGWANLLAPAINVVRFYEALPVLQLNATNPALANWEVIFQRSWDCVVCLPGEVLALRGKSENTRTTSATIGLSLPLKSFRVGGSGAEILPQNLESMISESRPAIITTAGDLPVTTDMKRLATLLGVVRRAI
jgi:chemotaxis protein CheY-P-specific phosphatase CheC